MKFILFLKGDNHPLPLINTHQNKNMSEHIHLELHHETIAKLEKLAESLGLSVDQLIDQSIQELLYETQQAHS